MSRAGAFDLAACRIFSACNGEGRGADRAAPSESESIGSCEREAPTMVRLRHDHELTTFALRRAKVH